MDEQNGIQEELLISIDHPEAADEHLTSSYQEASSDRDANDGTRESYTCSWRFFFESVLVFTIIGSLIAALVLIIAITPYPPIVHVVSMQISNFKISSPSFLTPTRLSAAWNITFMVKNPDKKLRVSYKNASVTIYYWRKLMWEVPFDSFDQEGGEENEAVVMGDNKKPVSLDNVVARGIEEDLVTRGVVEFDLEFEGRVGFCPVTSVVWGVQNMTARCSNVQARFLGEKSDGTRRVLSDCPKECRVRLPMFSRRLSSNLKVSFF